MAEQYVVTSSAMLGFPNTDRTFHQGEIVTEADFARCPERFEAFIKRGSLKKANEDEMLAGQAIRERNDALHLGLDAGTPRPEVLKLLQAQNEAMAKELPPKEEPAQKMPQTGPPEPLRAATPADVSAPPVAVVTAEHRPRARDTKGD